MKSPLLAKIKFEPTFFQVLWRLAFSLPLPAYSSVGQSRRAEWGFGLCPSARRANR